MVVVMSQVYTVAVLVGSLRKASFNMAALRTAIELKPAGMSVEVADISAIPLYNEDIDVDPPAAYKTFREQIKGAQGLLFVTPEYNRSVPGVLKNAIDVGSRPYGQSVFSGKPGAVISVSPGAVGGFGANHHLRQSLVFLDVPCLQQPEAYVGGAASLFDEQGKLSEKSRPFLQGFIDSYAKWVARHQG